MRGKFLLIGGWVLLAAAAHGGGIPAPKALKGYCPDPGLVKIECSVRSLNGHCEQAVCQLCPTVLVQPTGTVAPPGGSTGSGPQPSNNGPVVVPRSKWGPQYACDPKTSGGKF